MQSRGPWSHLSPGVLTLDPRGCMKPTPVALSFQVLMETEGKVGAAEQDAEE